MAPNAGLQSLLNALSLIAALHNSEADPVDSMPP
jgi:hypothetical protein